MYWPLMKETITLKDRLKMAKFILTSSKLTNGPKVRQFEEEWSKWVGCDHSLYVSSGSTANFLLIAAVKEMYNLKDGDKVLLPACTWMTNVAPIFQLGLQPIFCDVNLENFSFDPEDFDYVRKKHPDIKLIFLTHLLGFYANKQVVQDAFPNALILDDVCESHGVLETDAPNPSSKVGSCGLGATFSFYFGHHMSTIEGGMVCTNNASLYELMRMKRSHGLAREASPDRFEVYKKQYKDLNDKFLFVTDGYNFRNHEVCAVLGISQLKRLDQMIAIRRRNYDMFYSYIASRTDKFYLPAYEGNSNFAFPIITKDRDDAIRVKTILDCNEIENRPVVSGNLLRHPFLKNYSIVSPKENMNVDILHQNGVYVGNSHFVTMENMQKLFTLLDTHV